jgi:hypothetical protein
MSGPVRPETAGVFVKRVFLGLAAAVVSACTLAAAAAVPEPVRKPVEAFYTREHQDMVDPDEPNGFRIQMPSGIFSKVDVNDDGVTDWMIDYERAQNPSLFCGTGGCLRQVYVSRDGGYVLAFDRVIRQFKLRRAKGQRLLDLDFHGSTCGGAGVEECPRGYVWDEHTGRFIERPNARGGTWLQGGPSPLVATPASAAPRAVQNQLQRRAAFCAAAGGKAPEGEDSVFNDLPDLNGDGVRDWVVGSYYDYCEMGETGKDSPPIPTVILISKGGDFVVGFEGAEVNWGVDLAPTPTFKTVEGADDCAFQEEKPCARISWRWNGEMLVRTP